MKSLRNLLKSKICHIKDGLNITLMDCCFKLSLKKMMLRLDLETEIHLNLLMLGFANNYKEIILLSPKIAKSN